MYRVLFQSFVSSTVSFTKGVIALMVSIGIEFYIALSIAFFSVITQRVVVISYRRFGTTYRSHPQGPRIQFYTLCSKSSLITAIKAKAK